MLCDRIAYRNRVAFIVSLVAPNMSIKAARAIVSTTDKYRFEVDRPDSGTAYLGPSESGYRVLTEKVGRWNGRLILIAKDERLLVNGSDDALWAHLASDRFSTPVQRHWIPRLKQTLVEKNRFVMLDGFGCDAALCNLDTEALDQIVASGLSCRDFIIR